jgi:hypothetical protein
MLSIPKMPKGVQAACSRAEKGELGREKLEEWPISYRISKA